MVEEVWRRASMAARLERLIIATDDPRIMSAAAGFGAEAMLTSSEHRSGTDRVAEVVRVLGSRYDVVINIQGDEPLLTPTCLDRLVRSFEHGSPRPAMATLAEPLLSVEELWDPNVVKVVATTNGQALYFSRSPIPYYRGSAGRLAADFGPALARRPGGLAGYRKHQGIYAYTRQTILELTRLEPSALELDEGLEQLRALQAGFTIHVVDSDFRSLSVDTPADLERAARRLMEAN